MKKRRKYFAAEVFEGLDALCTNKDRNKVAVTGRTVAKVYAVYDDRFELRTERNKPKKTMYYSGSIAWSPLRENLIASASSIGAVYLWDPESSQNIECFYKAHKQLVTKVCFNEFNENILVSGSKDSTVWLYDLRSAEPSTCFASNQDDSIRDIKFCLESKMQDTFVTAGDSGTIRFWDARRPDRALKEFIAHSSQVYSIALNPQIQSKNLIATAGRDKYIRIWDWSKNTPQFLYTVEMMAIITRVSWCPDNLWHVACCFAPPSGFVSSDNTIYVWDIRRPYIPYASFNSHTRTCTDMSWPTSGHGDTFLSCGKDGKLIMNYTDSALRPIVYANTVTINSSTSFNDELIVAVPSYRRKSSSTIMESTEPFRRKVPSTLFTVTAKDPFLMDGRTLAYLAQNYKIVGNTINELCEHNAQVAERIFKDRLAYVWRMIALLCSQTDFGTLRSKFALNNLLKRKYSSNYLQDHKNMDTFDQRERDNRSRNLTNSLGDDHHQRGEEDDRIQPDGLINASSTAVLISGSLNPQNAFSADIDLFFGTEELNFGGMSEMDAERTMPSSKRSIVSSSIITLSQLKEEAFDLNERIPRHHHRRFSSSVNRHRTIENKKTRRLASYEATSSVFGSFDNDVSSFGADEAMEESEDDKIKSTFRRIQHKNLRRKSSVAVVEAESDNGGKNDNEEEIEDDDDEDDDLWEDDEDVWDNDLNRKMSEFNHYSLNLNEGFGTELNNCLSRFQQQNSLLQFDPLPTLKSLLDFYSNLGDVQMCATIGMVIGERLLDYKLVSAAQMDMWFLGYIELLERLKLWSTSALLIKSCFRPKINQMSNESTFVKVWCKYCRNTATRPSLRCTKCHQAYNYLCIICETTVRGIWSSCADCGHGGHLTHMQQWFGKSQICPAIGCGHECAASKTYSAINNSKTTKL